MTEPTDRDRIASLELAKAFTDHIKDEGLILDFWGESDGEGELAGVAAPFIAIAREEGRREERGRCAKIAEAAAMVRSVPGKLPGHARRAPRRGALTP